MNEHFAVAPSPSPRMSVRQWLHPRSVAIVGASEDEAKWGGRLLRYMTRHRIAGELYPVNARADTLLGHPSYASVSDCPGPVDMAILLVPSHHALAAVNDCVAKGVGCAVAITAGFAETGEAGLGQERELVAAARAGGMRLIGPNCMGLMNAHHNLAATTGVVMGQIDQLPAGGIGLASQSGALMGAMLSRGIDIGARFSTTVSVGNQCDVDQNDIFEYLIDDPLTEIVCLYLEGVKDAPRFAALLARAQAAAKPVLIAKSGRSEAGERAVRSHTASLAGAWPAFEAVCRAYGVYLFDSIFDLLHGAQMLQRPALVSAPGVAVFSGSGGGGALLVDALEPMGLPLPALSANTKERLASVLPASHRELPLDFGMLKHGATPDPVYGQAAGTAMGRIMEDDAVGAGIVLLTTQPNMGAVAEMALTVGRNCGKPLLFVQGAGNAGQAARDIWREAGYGYVESPHDALHVIAALMRRAATPQVQAHDSALARPALPVPDTLPGGYLSEPDARCLIEAAGIPTTRWVHAENASQAVAAARSLGGEVVVKAVSPTLVHKSDIGAVRLALQGDDAVRLACAQIDAALAANGHTLDGYLVTEMVHAEAELILGVQNDPDFGPMVLVGAGGVLVELMKDVQLCPAPLSPAQARAMLSRLRCRPLLEGWRGRPPVDLDRLANTLVQLGQLATTLGPRLQELDINPLMIVDGRILAADARAVLA